MSELHRQSLDELEQLFQQALEAGAPATVRAIGSIRVLGDLRITGFEIGVSISLCGAKHRDLILPKGTAVALTVLLGEDVLSLQARMLDPILARESDTLFPPILRMDWPQGLKKMHDRNEVRVGAPDLPPMKATLESGNRIYLALLLNLTETGMGLGLTERIFIDLNTSVEMGTELPDGTYLFIKGAVRHLAWLEEDPLPTRIGLVIESMTDLDRENLRCFIQARRTDRSEIIRIGRY